MTINADIILYTKYALATMIAIAIIMAPAYLAAHTNKEKTVALRVRLASWLFLFTGIGWLLALFWSARK